MDHLDMHNSSTGRTSSPITPMTYTRGSSTPPGKGSGWVVIVVLVVIIVVAVVYFKNKQTPSIEPIEREITIESF